MLVKIQATAALTAFWPCSAIAVGGDTSWSLHTAMLKGGAERLRGPRLLEFSGPGSRKETDVQKDNAGHLQRALLSVQ